jgi:Transcriptional regulatory protein, C terminal
MLRRPASDSRIGISSLSPTEYTLLHHLAMNAGRVLVHEEVLRRVWGAECQKAEPIWEETDALPAEGCTTPSAASATAWTTTPAHRATS